MNKIITPPKQKLDVHAWAFSTLVMLWLTFSVQLMLGLLCQGDLW